MAMAMASALDLVAPDFEPTSEEATPPDVEEKVTPEHAGQKYVVAEDTAAEENSNVAAGDAALDLLTRLEWLVHSLLFIKAPGVNQP